MNQPEMIFNITDHKKIILYINDSLHQLNYYTSVSIVFISDNQHILLSDGLLYDDIDRLYQLLKTALNNTLQLDSSIKKDIGFVYNQYCDAINNKTSLETSYFHCIKSGSIDYWIGDYYHLWANKYISWMYNDLQGSIILEITPFYPYFYCDKKEKPNYISYKTWIKNYQPYLIATLSRETAQQWLDQAEYIVKTVENNVKQWEKESKQ